MRIIEKKCPNCHANLEFDVGETNVKCSNCRRAYAIEYGKDFVDPEVQLKSKDIQLKILDDIDNSLKFKKIITIIVFVLMFAIIVSSIIFSTFIFRNFQDTRQEFLRVREEADDIRG